MHHQWVCRADWTGMWDTLLVSSLLGVFAVAAFARNLPRIRGMVRVKG